MDKGSLSSHDRSVKSAEEAYAANPLFDVLPCGCLILDADHYIVSANQTIAEWVGIDAKQITGKYFSDLLTMGSKLFFASNHIVREGLQGGVAEMSYDLRGADGKAISVFLTARQLPDYRRIYLLYRAEVRRRYEQKLIEAKQAAEENLRARATFLTTVTHEVRTPIHAILSAAELLQESSLDADQDHLLKLLQNSGQALLNLVGDVLDLSRAERKHLTVNPIPTNISGLVDLVLATLRPTVPDPKVSLKAIVDPGCPDWAILDAGKLRQVLTNLVSNAIRYTSEGSIVVKVTCAEPALPNDARTAFTFSIEDTGVGIEAAQLKRIFKPFEQVRVDDEKTGTGLGLPISQRIVRALDGELNVESTVGKGSRFFFTLLAEATAPSEHEGVALREKFQPKFVGKRVLVVDDNATNLFIARRHLHNLGCEVAEAAGGAEALALAAEHTYDIVLLDLRMPKIDGYTVAARLREMPQYASTPIVAVSAASVQPSGDVGEPSHISGHMTKPFTAAQLSEVLSLHLPHNDVRGSSVTNSARKDMPVVESAPLPRASIDTDLITKEFAHDLDELPELLGLMAKEFSEEANSITKAVSEGDFDTLTHYRHKWSTALRYLSPEPLKSLIIQEELPNDPAQRAQLAERMGTVLQDTARLILDYIAQIKRELN